MRERGTNTTRLRCGPCVSGKQKLPAGGPVRYAEEAGGWMLTIFSVPKAFQVHIGTLERDALKRWTSVETGPELRFHGSDAWAVEIAREMGLRHNPGIAVNQG